MSALNENYKHVKSTDIFATKYETATAASILTALLGRKVETHITPAELPIEPKTAHQVVKKEGTERQVAESDASTPKNLRLDANTPIYGATDKKENIHDWVFTIECAFASGGIPDNRKLQCVTSYLRGPLVNHSFVTCVRTRTTRTGTNSSRN